MKNIPELLAPVGGYKQLMAAVENGADAVYLGGEFFNARINADNFDMETMAKAISYAHIRNVKVYVTMNILLYDDELESALRYAGQLYALGVDALIVQDMGFAHILRKHLPGLKLHLSTQGTVYNASGVEMATKLGFDRIVLAREATLAEIGEICGSTTAEIEVFAHGALCMCYSGQCQLSRNLGGRSGNRGLCAQPCRLPYETDGTTSYPLSAKDICTVDMIPALTRAGVASLKIEGRMKSPEYVAIVTGIYRKYLDLYQREEEYNVSDEDRQALEQIFNRGELSPGYLNGNPGDGILSGMLPKHHGVKIGKVLGGQSGKGLISIHLDSGKSLRMGDGIEIRNKELPGNVVTYIKEEDMGVLTVGDIKGRVFPGDAVYKITDRELMERARSTYKEDSWEAMKSLKKIEISMHFRCVLGQAPILEIQETSKLDKPHWRVMTEGTKMAEKALHRPITEETIKEQLGKLGDTPFRAKDIPVSIDAGISLPVSVLNELRREGISQLIQLKTKGRPFGEIQYKFTERGMPSVDRQRILELFYYSIHHIKMQDLVKYKELTKDTSFPFETHRMLVPVQEFLDLKKNASDFHGYEVIPYIPNISKGKVDKYLEVNFRRIVEASRESGIYIGNLGWIEAFKNAGLPILGDYGLNLNNQEAENWAEDIGLTAWVPSLESFNGTQESGWMYRGAVPLMITEHPVNKKLKSTQRDFTLEASYQENMEKSIISMKSSNDLKDLSRELRNTRKNVRVFVL